MKTERREAYDAFMKFYPLTLNDLDGEQWRPIDGYEDYYVSNFGRVKSCKPDRKPRILRPACSPFGYLHVTFCVGNKTKNFLTHRLVAIAFIPNSERKPQVNHRDGRPLNCHVSNLEWATPKENTRHAHTTGLAPSGSERPEAKFTNEQIVIIRNNRDNLTCAQLAKKFGVRNTTISEIQLGKKYRNAGGTVRGKIERRLPDEIRQQIRAEYVYRSHEFGSTALAKRYGVTGRTILDIVKEVIE